MKNKEQINKLIESIFSSNPNISNGSRVFIGDRGCIERGSIDIGDFSHCGNKECISCNNSQIVFKEELIK